jgi:hypothetical protein
MSNETGATYAEFEPVSEWKTSVDLSIRIYRRARESVGYGIR